MRKTVPFTRQGIDELPNNSPAVYKILTAGGRINYVGVAQRGRVRDRLHEHLPGGKDYVPGAQVRVEYTRSITDARAKEERVISGTEPPYNVRGK